ncbi:hypothetical protein T484DRAFT_1960875 [Baffinella frigidus]|nr:hypothetical protein T484DRAFT_1960875 [Cryptophyta sp. CCMP2293]
MSLRIAYRRVLGFIAEGLFKIPSKSAVWLPGSRSRGGSATGPSGLFYSYVEAKIAKSEKKNVVD